MASGSTDHLLSEPAMGNAHELLCQYGLGLNGSLDVLVLLFDEGDHLNVLMMLIHEWPFLSFPFGMIFALKKV